MKSESIIYTLPNNTGYDALEVHTVLILDDFVEALIDGEEIPEGSVVSWSLYGHVPNEGLECIGDFNSFDSACEVAKKLGGNKF
jgi:hypothetical protein